MNGDPNQTALADLYQLSRFSTCWTIIAYLRGSISNISCQPSDKARPFWPQNWNEKSLWLTFFTQQFQIWSSTCMQTHVTLPLAVLFAFICSTWATHYEMLTSSTSKICRKFHFSYISFHCFTTPTSESDSTPNSDLFEKKVHQKRIIFHDFSPLFYYSTYIESNDVISPPFPRGVPALWCPRPCQEGVW